MVSIPSLWLPILVSAVFVFAASSIIHMALPYHRKDFDKVPREDEVMDALRPFEIPPGEYVIPCAATPKEMSAPEFIERMKKGPVAFLTVLPPGPPSMAKTLLEWFVYCIVVGVLAAYVAGRALGSDAAYLAAFRFAGTTAFIGYSAALWQSSIWYKRKWSTTLKSTFDGLVYGLLTGGTFGWLWPS